MKQLHRRWAYAVGCLMILLMGVSRLYLACIGPLMYWEALCLAWRVCYSRILLLNIRHAEDWHGPSELTEKASRDYMEPVLRPSEAIYASLSAITTPSALFMTLPAPWPCGKTLNFENCGPACPGSASRHFPSRIWYNHTNIRRGDTHISGG